jgi:two-component system sensor histidine kinase RegB
MSGRAGGSAVDQEEVVDVRMLVKELQAGFPSDRLHVSVSGDFSSVVVPRAGLRQSILSLVNNAFDASVGTSAPVLMAITLVDQRLGVTVRDQGAGLIGDAVRRAGEPFFTTKEAGCGMGLGLFLSRAFAERLGGSLSLESDDGTTAVLELPCRVATLEVS